MFPPVANWLETHVGMASTNKDTASGRETVPLSLRMRQQMEAEARREAETREAAEGEAAKVLAAGEAAAEGEARAAAAEARAAAAEAEAETARAALEDLRNLWTARWEATTMCLEDGPQVADGAAGGATVADVVRAAAAADAATAADGPWTTVDMAAFDPDQAERIQALLDNQTALAALSAESMAQIVEECKLTRSEAAERQAQAETLQRAVDEAKAHADALEERLLRADATAVQMEMDLTAEREAHGVTEARRTEVERERDSLQSVIASLAGRVDTIAARGVGMLVHADEVDPVRTDSSAEALAAMRESRNVACEALDEARAQSNAVARQLLERIAACRERVDAAAGVSRELMDDLTRISSSTVGLGAQLETMRATFLRITQVVQPNATSIGECLPAARPPPAAASPLSAAAPPFRPVHSPPASSCPCGMPEFGVMVDCRSCHAHVHAHCTTDNRCTQCKTAAPAPRTRTKPRPTPQPRAQPRAQPRTRSRRGKVRIRLAE